MKYSHIKIEERRIDHMPTTVAVNHQALVPLRKQTSFIILIITSFLASISFSMFIFTQSWFVLQQLHFKAGLGFIFIASSVPRIIFMVFGGVIADKVKKTRIIFLCMLIEVMLVFSIMTTLRLGIESIWVFVIVAFIFGISDALQIPARTSLLPLLVDQSQLTRANSIYSLNASGAGIAGAFLAGLSIHQIGFYQTFLFMIILTGTAAFLTFFIRYEQVKTTDGNGKEVPFFISLKEGFLYVKSSKFLVALFMLAVLLNFFIAGPMTMGIPIIADQVFGGKTIVFSMLESTFLSGTILGAITLSILNLNKHKGRVSLIAITCAGICLFFVGFTSTLAVMLGLIGSIGLLISLTNTPLMTLLQANTDTKMLGRVMSFLMVAAMGLTPLSYGLTSILITVGLSIQTIIWISSIPVIFVSVYTFLFVPAIRNAN